MISIDFIMGIGIGCVIGYFGGEKIIAFFKETANNISDRNKSSKKGLNNAINLN